MNKACKERRAGRAEARSSGLTRQAAGQPVEASRTCHTGQRSFARVRRCRRLKAPGLPAQRRLAREQNPAVRCGKIIEYGP